MIDAIITIAGREIPIRRSFRALNDFDTKFKAERMSMLNLDVARLRTEHVIYMLLFVLLLLDFFLEILQSFL